MTNFRTNKNKRKYPISPRRVRTGTMQTGTAHLSVPKKLLNKGLKKAIPEEKHDEKKYAKLGVKAEEAGQFEDAQQLFHISEQERQHGEIDEHILEHPDAATVNKWFEAEGSLYGWSKGEKASTRRLHLKQSIENKGLLRTYDSLLGLANVTKDKATEKSARVDYRWMAKKYAKGLHLARTKAR